MIDFLKRPRHRAALRPTAVGGATGAVLVGHGTVPGDARCEDAMLVPLQIDGDPASGRPASAASAPANPRDAFVVPGGLGLPAIALVNRRDPQARVELWALDSPAPTTASVFARRRELRLPPGLAPIGWQVAQVAALPRLQCLAVLCHDADPRTALVGVIDLASGTLRALGHAEPDPFRHEPAHVAALRAGPDAVLARWHEGRIRLGHWGDVAAQARVLLFTPLERDGLEVLRLSLDDGNIRGWGTAGATLWLQAVDGRLRPVPRVRAWSLDLSRVL
jgi:hypothetical protein